MSPVVLAALVALAPASDSLLVDVGLRGVDHVVVCAVLTSDSILLLPARDIHQLFGVEPPLSRWLTPGNILQRWPTLTVTVNLRALEVWIDDPQQVLPATRAFYARLQRQATGALPYVVTASGPFVAIAGDDSGRTLADVGYSWRGRIAVSAEHSSEHGTTWAAVLAPISGVYASVTGAHAIHGPTLTSATARLALGPVWLQPRWDAATDRVGADGLVSVGAFSVFASSRDVLLLTIKSRAGGFQLGRSSGSLVARASFGTGFPLSPFNVPTLR